MNKQEYVYGKKLQFNKGEVQLILFEDRMIGKGGFGQCYLGFYKGQLVLVKKILRKKNKSLTQFRQAYERELKLIAEAARTHRKSQISNIVYVEPISIMSSDNSHAYIIMEYCRGGSLSSLMDLREKKNNWFNFEEFCTIFLQIIKGYLQLYSVNILHQDLKPDNVFFSQGLFKIGDFGLSYKLSSKEGICKGGTRAYCGPEVFSQAKSSQASDIYSMGIIFYELMYNEHPYYRHHQWEEFLWQKQNQASIKFDTILGKDKIALKNMELLNRNKFFWEFIKSRTLCKGQVIQIRDKQNHKQQIKVLKALILKMINLDYQKRPKIQQIMLQVEKMSLPVCYFACQNQKFIPQKYRVSIIKQSVIFNSQIYLELKFYKQGENEPRQIPLVRDQLKRMNLITLSLFEITYSIEQEIKSKENFRFPRIISELKNLNYNLAYHSYCQVLETIKDFQPDVRSYFYQTGQDYLLDNMRSNKEILEEEIDHYLILKKRSRRDSLNIIKQVFEEEVLKQSIALSEENMKLFKLLMILYRMIKGNLQLIIEQGQIEEGKSIELEISKAKDQMTILMETEISYDDDCQETYEKMSEEGFKMIGFCYQ